MIEIPANICIFNIGYVFLRYCLVICIGQLNSISKSLIGPLQDPVTWYGINYTGTQMTQWNFQNKGKSGWTGTSSFVLEVPLRYLRPSVIYSVPCDQILQRAYSLYEQSLDLSPRERSSFSTHSQVMYLLPIEPRTVESVVHGN